MTTVDQLSRGIQLQDDMRSEHKTTTPRHSTTDFTNFVSRFSGHFETALENSHVYSRFNADCELDVSAAGSTFNGSAWSGLSRFSFNDMSIVSVYRLPVILSEVDAIGSHLTFGRFMRGYQSRASSAGLPDNGESTTRATLASTTDRLDQGSNAFDVSRLPEAGASQDRASSTYGTFQSAGTSSEQQTYRSLRARKRGKAPKLSADLPHYLVNTAVTNTKVPPIV